MAEQEACFSSTGFQRLVEAQQADSAAKAWEKRSARGNKLRKGLTYRMSTSPVRSRPEYVRSDDPFVARPTETMLLIPTKYLLEKGTSHR